MAACDPGGGGADALAGRAVCPTGTAPARAMTLRVYNTLSRSTEKFVPNRPGLVRMYVCGPNLYGPAHVGHALSYLIFDVIRRYLEYRGFQVRYVQNFTDIEDRIIETASAQGTTVQALARQYADRFLREMDRLGVQRASVYPRATEMIPQMQDMIRRIIEHGMAYQADGDVFFRVTAFPRYGRLSGRSLDEMQAGSRVEIDPRKEHPMDFVLWKAAKPGEPAWDSPWGPGRPGWHIECSAMSLSLLGEQLDIHGGGQDVIFPHHENEIAQSEAYTGTSPFVRFWVHNGLLRLAEGEEKMTRHLGNIVTIEEALERYHPDAIRVFVLSSHYRGPTKWTEEGLASAARGAERLRTAAEHGEAVWRRGGGGQTTVRRQVGLGGGPLNGEDRPTSSVPLAADGARDAFEAAMDDDFNTPRALAALFELATSLNRAADAIGRSGNSASPAELADLRRGLDVLRTLAGVLGLRLSASLSPEQEAALHRLARDLVHNHPELFDVAHPLFERLGAAATEGIPAGEELIAFIAEGRMRARRLRDWTTGDTIRSRLQEIGILLEDSPTGYQWRLR
jgi:cysteinyl-tRNA synthetase